MLDLAGDVADHHRVTDLHRPLEQQDETRDEIVDHVLQAEADADAQGAGEDRRLGQVDAEDAQGDEEAERRGSRSAAASESAYGTPRGSVTRG